jgi:hydroxymethylglutaryl-CoA reductase (NADPH)
VPAKRKAKGAAPPGGARKSGPAKAARPAAKKLKDGGDPVSALLEGGLKMHELDQGFGMELAAQIRRAAVARDVGLRMRAIPAGVVRPEDTKGSIENFIGVAQVPVGLAGPLRVKGGHADGRYWLPLATTEGALVASVSRGCSVINAAGGARSRLIADAMTRAPAFACRDIEHVLKTRAWVQKNLEKVRQAAEATTRHGKLLGISPYVVGRTLYLRFHYTTGDAMGMNMATIATEAAARAIERGTGARLVALSGNMCTDKKAAAINLIEGRGKSVVAEATLPGKLVWDKLHAVPDDIVDVHIRKNLVGSAKAGALGFNAHFANVVAALFVATGQDAAQVVDGSLGFTTVEREGDGLYVAVTLPALEVGTVGGGTRLPTQAEALRIMRCAGAGKAREFAEVVAAAVLAGEVSLLGAMAAGHLGRAHARLGR